MYTGIVGGFLIALVGTYNIQFSLLGLAFLATLAGLFAKTFFVKLAEILNTLVGAPTHKSGYLGITISLNRRVGMNYKKITKGALLSVCIAALICCVTVTGFSPNRGFEDITVVTIQGRGFESNPTGNTVRFGGVEVPDENINYASSTIIKALIPIGARTGLITVSTDRGTGRSKGNFIVDTPSKWTVLVYLDADNNLEDAGLDDFNEMALIGSTVNLNVVVQMDRWEGGAYGNWTGARRFLIQSGDTPSAVPVQDLGEVNMGDPQVLQDFIEWGVTNYHSEHYALIIWNHGDGWRQFIQKRMEKSRTLGAEETAVALFRAVASDWTDNDELYMKEVQEAIRGAKNALRNKYNTEVKIDLVGFDACLMGMVEVAYALRGLTDYVVFSENCEPWDGWPYDQILPVINIDPAVPASNFGVTIVTEYIISYPYDGDVTQSAIDMEHLDALVREINEFTQVATSDWSALKRSRENTIEYHACCYPFDYLCWGVDLFNFMQNVYLESTSTEIRQAAQQVQGAIQQCVRSEEHGSQVGDSHGIAIYFPRDLNTFNADPDHTGYEDDNEFMIVDFVKYNQWDNWLQTFYANTP